jgi:hypothetical protein
MRQKVRKDTQTLERPLDLEMKSVEILSTVIGS